MKRTETPSFQFSLRDTLITCGILFSATIVCVFLRTLDNSDTYVAMIFLLSITLIARFTTGYFYGSFAALLSVFLVNYVFTYPYFEFTLRLPGYPLTFFCMLAVSLITSTLTTQVKEQERVRAAAAKERLRGNLLRAVSHDLRTPLTSILGASSAILESKGHLDDTERTALVRGIHEDAEWLLRMVENLLSITRIGDGQAASLKKRPEAAEEVLGAALAKFKKRYSMPVEVSVPDELLMVPMDALLIEQVLLNLLENAVLHGETTTRIRLSAQQAGPDAVFTVSDNGRGIPRSSFEYLFDGYLGRAECETSDQTRGMGIGLSVCRSIIKAHGGAMTAENLDSGGACLRFTLPMEEENS